MRSKVRVLVIDDSRFARQMIKAIVEQGNEFDVVAMAEDGRKGIELAKQAKPDLITLDLDMPGINGEETLKRIRKHSSVPVVIVSGTPTEVTTQLGLEQYHPIGFVTKQVSESPIALSLFTAELVRVLRETIANAR